MPLSKNAKHVSMYLSAVIRAEVPRVWAIVGPFDKLNTWLTGIQRVDMVDGAPADQVPVWTSVLPVYGEV